MGVFIQPPFWAQEYDGRQVAPRAVAVRVTPAIPIGSSSIANPTVLTTATAHPLVSGDTVAIADHAGSTPALNGSHVATVISPTQLSVPLAVTVAGAGGTVTRTIAAEPLTLAEAKLWAGLDWADGDPREALLTGFIASARRKVEQDTGIALLLTTFDVYLDALPRDRTPIALPWRPVPWITSVASIDTAGVTQTLDVSQYELDPGSEVPLPARVALSTVGAWPTDLRPFQPYVLRLVAGYPSVAALTAAAPLLVHAVGLLTAHYATLGRDFASVDALSEVPGGYADLIAAYQLVTVA